MSNDAKQIRWVLLGLSKVHDAMIRRIALRELDCMSNDVGELNLSIEWIVIDAIGDSGLSSGIEYSTCWVCRDALIDFASRTKNSNPIVMLQSKPTGAMNILWAFHNASPRDAVWASELRFQGVVDSVVRLRSWCRSVIARGRRFEKPPHFLLRDLPIPTF